MNIIIKNKIKIISEIIFFVFCFLFFVFNVNASTLYFTSTNAGPSINKDFRVDVYIDTNDNNINAFESYIEFNESSLELKKIYTGNSTVDFWIKDPRVQGNKIFFSGMTPGGYSGKNGLLMSAIFRAKKVGTTIISADQSNSKFLLNDGLASEDKLIVNNLTIDVLGSGTVSQNNDPVIDNNTNPIDNNVDNSNNQNSDNDQANQETDNNQDIVPKDNTRPEGFPLKITKDEKIDKDKFVLLFYTQDKDSGIDHYEIKEGDGEFKIGESPYTLEDQSLTKEIQVKAVDKDGNYRIEKIGPLILNETTTINYSLIIILLAIMIVILVALNIYIDRKKKEKEKNIYVQ